MEFTITFGAIIEVLGKPQEHVEKAIKEYVEKLEKNENYQVTNKKFAKIKKQEEEGLWATFDHTNRHIYLVRPWSLFNVFDQSTLLHEMIHDIQLSNREWDCLGAPELEAYLLQDKWLQEHGIYHQFNWPAIIRMSQCTGEDDVE